MARGSGIVGPLWWPKQNYENNCAIIMIICFNKHLRTSSIIWKKMVFIITCVNKLGPAEHW